MLETNWPILQIKSERFKGRALNLESSPDATHHSQQLSKIFPRRRKL